MDSNVSKVITGADDESTLKVRKSLAHLVAGDDDKQSSIRIAVSALIDGCVHIRLLSSL